MIFTFLYILNTQSHHLYGLPVEFLTWVFLICLPTSISNFHMSGYLSIDVIWVSINTSTNHGLFEIDGCEWCLCHWQCCLHCLLTVQAALDSNLNVKIWTAKYWIPLYITNFLFKSIYLLNMFFRNLLPSFTVLTQIMYFSCFRRLRYYSVYYGRIPGHKSELILMSQLEIWAIIWLSFEYSFSVNFHKGFKILWSKLAVANIGYVT